MRLADIAAKAEIVLVDTPAGMFGTTHQILSGCTHVIGVLQSEVVAHRSFAMFMHGLEALPADRRPSVLGVFLNMLQVGHAASVAVLSDICAELPKDWLFDTAIPRTTAFLDASEAGIPLRLLDDKSPPAVTWLFDTLATEVTERLKLPVPERRKQRLLV
jgi:cellulose biosynthesis protein BcsQ